MALINLTGAYLSYSDAPLLDHTELHIEPNERVCLVGRNGAGKSTLMKVLAGEQKLDDGRLQVQQDVVVARLEQDPPRDAQGSVFDYVAEGVEKVAQQLKDYHDISLKIATDPSEQNLAKMARLQEALDHCDGWRFESRIHQVMEQLNLKEDMALSELSGGWLRKAALARALVSDPDVLLLDEPTNHLDLDAVIWLEKWLNSYRGTLVLISHDRDFLDPIVDKILHIEQQRIDEYTGNYSSFEVQRVTKLSQQQSLYESQQAKVAHLQSFIDRFKAKASKAKQAQSRVKALERMELIAPAHVDNPFRFSFRAPESLPNPILSMEKVSAGYGEKIILNSVKLNLVPGSRIGLLGRNGAGKSTLIKLLAGELAPLHGVVELSRGIKLGYFAQHQLETLHPEESPLVHLARLAPRETEQQLRDYLGGFGFRGDKVTDPVAPFSGGEKARLVLALIVWQRPNLLLLDEPTNHLDLDMRQALTEALIDFDGAMVVVSHDRHLLRSTTDDLYLVHDGQVELFRGDLDDYQRWLSEEQKREQQDSPATNSTGDKDNTNSAQARKEQKRREAEFRQQTQPLRRQLTKLEKELETLTSKLQEVETQLADPALYDASQKVRMTELLSLQVSTKNALEETEMAWLDAQSELENLQQAFDALS